MAPIRLHNTKTRRKEDFVPLDANNVRMYVCGPTVYDRAHIGNARPVVVFDVLFRLLRHVYGADHVTYVRNFTDVDDKINARATQTGRAIRDITDETIGWYHADMDALGALRPTFEPRATEHIAGMITMIMGLIASGHAYAAEGHVLFDVRSYPDYGRLSGRSIDDMIAGARVEVAPYKRDPMDFVLWKPSYAETPGWDSPWGHGRPGWHIECSAMSLELLGPSFDIHGGGLDLQFPHHENEIAQSACAHPGADFAKVWMHNEMLQVEGKKMSKSLGNFFTVRDLLDQGVPGEVIRFVMLGTHYSKPMDWTKEKAAQAEATLRKWRDLFGTGPVAISSEVPSEVLQALSDDLNTPMAIAELHKLSNLGRVAELISSARLIGLLSPEQADWYQEPNLPEELEQRISKLVRLRNIAKKERNFALADSLREGLENCGVSLKDGKDGTEWHFDHMLGSRLLHDRLVHLLSIGAQSELSTLVESLRLDGFGVDIDDTEMPAFDRIRFYVGRTPQERARVVQSIELALNDLEAPL